MIITWLINDDDDDDGDRDHDDVDYDNDVDDEVSPSLRQVLLFDLPRPQHLHRIRCITHIPVIVIIIVIVIVVVTIVITIIIGILNPSFCTGCIA